MFYSRSINRSTSNQTQETNWRSRDPLHAGGRFAPVTHAPACLSRASRSVFCSV